MKMLVHPSSFILVERLVLGEEFVYQDNPVVADHLAGAAAVMVLVTDDPAAAGKIPVVGDQTFLVLLLVVVPVHNPSTRGPFT
jgi:hypothetical protein